MILDHAKIEKMICQPTYYFDNPKDVLDSTELAVEEKINILESWKHTCEQIQICNDEGMTKEGLASKNEEELQKVTDALNELKPQEDE